MEDFEKYLELLSIHKNLNADHIKLYSIIVNSCKEFGKCNLSNNEFAKLLGIKYDPVARLINGLISYRLINRVGHGKTRCLVLN